MQRSKSPKVYEQTLKQKYILNFVTYFNFDDDLLLW